MEVSESVHVNVSVCVFERAFDCVCSGPTATCAQHTPCLLSSRRMKPLSMWRAITRLGPSALFSRAAHTAESTPPLTMTWETPQFGEGRIVCGERLREKEVESESESESESE